MRFWRFFAIPAAVASVSCIARGEPDPVRVPRADTGAAGLTDSLVLTAPGGATIWLTEGRAAVSAGGQPCLERTIEIRRDSVRLKVPLLYTVTRPVLLDDTTLRAELAEHCRPARTYRVNLRTAQPSPLEAR